MVHSRLKGYSKLNHPTNSRVNDMDLIAFLVSFLTLMNWTVSKMQISCFAAMIFRLVITSSNDEYIYIYIDWKVVYSLLKTNPNLYLCSVL